MAKRLGMFFKCVFWELPRCALRCAGTDTHLRMLENSNALQIEASQIKDFDYVVRMKT